MFKQQPMTPLNEIRCDNETYSGYKRNMFCLFVFYVFLKKFLMLTKSAFMKINKWMNKTVILWNSITIKLILLK